MRPIVALLFAALTGCNGHRIHDRSPDPIPEPLTLSAPLGTRVICTAAVREGPDAPGPAATTAERWSDEASAVLALSMAEELAARLRAAGSFDVVDLSCSTQGPRAGEVELSLTETVLIAPSGRGLDGETRHALTMVFLFWPLLPVMIPLDFVYLDHGEVRVHYALECRDHRGETLAQYETLAVIGIEEQATGCPGPDPARPWLRHGSLLRLARDRSMRVLVGAFSRDEHAHVRVRGAMRATPPRHCRGCGARGEVEDPTCHDCGALR